MEEDLKKQLETKDDLLNKLQEELKLKDGKLENTKELIKNLEKQHDSEINLINNLKDSIKLKEDQIETLKTSMKLKEDQIEILKVSASKDNENSLAEKEEQIIALQKELEILTGELAKADEDLEQLEMENEKLRKDSSINSLIDFTNYEIPKSQIIEKMKQILQNALHNITLSVPVITDLEDLYLYNIKSSVSMQIYCSINQGIKEHAELLDELESLDNISIRNYAGKDRYVILKDGDELLFAVIGRNESNHLGLHTKDPNHIKFFKSLVIEGWLRSRKL